jgi:phage tail tape-measure protein
MQEKQDIACGVGGAGIHLQAAPTQRGQDAIGEGAGQFGRPVAAAAVGDHHFDAACPIGRKRGQRGFDTGGLVEYRHDDREFHRAAACAMA